MSIEALRRWWRDLWRRPAAPAAGPEPRAYRGVAPAEADRDPADRDPAPPRRRYSAPPADDDPRREARLGAVLQALARGPLDRAQLADRVGAAEWGPGRLDAVVAHGVASGVLLDAGDGTVRARYAD